MLAPARQLPEARCHLDERLCGFAAERLAKNVSMLGFSRTVVARRAHLEPAHQFIIDVADNQGFCHLAKIAPIAMLSIDFLTEGSYGYADERKVLPGGTFAADVAEFGCVAGLRWENWAAG